MTEPERPLLAAIALFGAPGAIVIVLPAMLLTSYVQLFVQMSVLIAMIAPGVQQMVMAAWVPSAFIA